MRNGVYGLALLMMAMLTNVAVAQEPKKGKAAGGSEAATPIGDKASAKWTDTTEKAATTPEQKSVLEKGKATTVTGEVIDVSCYLQLGKKGEKHIPCGTNCIKNGQPIGILDDKGDVWVIFGEEHDPRRDGKIDLKPIFLPYLAKRVSVSGVAEEHNGTRGLFVVTSTLKPAAAPGAPAK